MASAVEICLAQEAKLKDTQVKENAVRFNPTTYMFERWTGSAWTPVGGSEIDESNLVHKTGNEIIAGTKTFTVDPNVKNGSPSYKIINTAITKGTAPTASESGNVYVYDVNGAAEANAIAVFYGRANKNGNIDTGLRAYKPESGSTTSAEIVVTYPASGYPYATCPTPKDASGNIETSDSSMKVATTQWAHSTFDGAIKEAKDAANAAQSTANAAQSTANAAQGAADASVKTVNGNTPDAAGNITPAQTGCLPLSGGTITGKIDAVNVADTLTLRNSDVSQYDTSRSQNYFTIPVKVIDKNNRIIGALEAHSDKTGSNRLDLHMQRGHGNTSEFIALNIWDHADGTHSIDFCGCETFLHPGMVIAFAGNWDPFGLLPCNGAAVSRSTYSRLFGAIGTTYGAGDGSTTFHLPNLTDGRFIQGSGTAGTYLSAGLPGIDARIYPNDHCGWPNGSADVGNCRSTNQAYWRGFNSVAYNAIYGSSATVQPPALTMRFYIKY